ncbi:helix-turn-helix domain-containing protein [Pseudomonas sp. CGJS7]|uniref:helix-turn-helix domain-containing protein n=1 Tax=Pseudomonas sp. CGJS7 TaxID=3109348 RepID=UPI00300B4A1A
MPTALNKPEYLRLRQLLVEARERAGLTQTQVAEKLQRAQSFVSKYELGERRLDVIDFMHVCASLGVDPGDVIRQIAKSRK